MGVEEEQEETSDDEDREAGEDEYEKNMYIWLRIGPEEKGHFYLLDIRM